MHSFCKEAFKELDFELLSEHPSISLSANWRVKMPTQNLLRLLLLLMLVMRIVLQQFVADLEAEVWS